MSVVPEASRPIGHTVIAFCLCLLAFSFAMEAKLAWYGPERGLGSDVRSAKALPADTPEQIPHGIPGANPIFPVFPFALLLMFATGSLPTECCLDLRTLKEYLPVFSSNYFSPHTFLRPPPVR
jgi:hypothetical protein